MDRDLSEDDSVGDLSFKAESPLAPPTELLERLSRHDYLLQSGRQQMLFPPSEAPGRPWEPLSWSSILDCRVPVVTEELAREALLSFVNSKCCYGSAAAGALVIQELRQQTLFRYRLETFSESRLSEWTFQPFTNHLVDGPHRGTSPKLWDIKVQVPAMFQEDTRKSQVPHSSLVKDCHKCCGHGRYKCSGCHGAGTRTRGPWELPGPASYRTVLTVALRCSMCSGRGSKTCSTCKGERKLVHFVQLVTMWRNSLFEFVSEPHLDCPRELLAKAKGENLFRDENSVVRRALWAGAGSSGQCGGCSHRQVYPIVDFPLRDISLASRRGISQHSAALASRGRILQQRQTIELVPLTEVHYWYQGKTSVYYIYGTDHQVYAAAYPAWCCCGCTIV
ncbi:hypothetical protein GW7_19498 [Heterocephalus glaber]|uniref:Protein SSUH2 homolog n=1 Tax=Heterocephalus glaber TaxID=10181 RepID=G5BX98_HETGA|nr:hypothetical protein GW7_19498 [Heterocephalus glaber]